MKLALMLPGLTRTWRKTYKNLFDLLECNFPDYEIDTYISTWDITGVVSSSMKSVISKFNNDWINNTKLSEVEIEEIKEIYSPKKFEIQDYEIWRLSMVDEIKEFSKIHSTNCSIQIMTNSFFAQFYKNKKVFELIDDPDQYDFIFRYRFDNISEYVKANFDINKITFPNGWGTFKSPDVVAYQDYWAIGNPQLMKIYSNIYDNFRIAEPGIFSKEYKNRYVPEEIFGYFLTQNNVETDLATQFKTYLVRK